MRPQFQHDSNSVATAPHGDCFDECNRGDGKTATHIVPHQQVGDEVTTELLVCEVHAEQERQRGFRVVPL